MTTLVIGGSASGKSEYAERRAELLPSPRFYIATMQPFGADGAERIARHRQMRKTRGFETIEHYSDLALLKLPRRGNALLEDIGNLVANELYGGNSHAAPPDELAERIARGVISLAEQCNDLLVVTNDVSRDGVRYDEETTRYIEVLEGVNRRLAAKFDETIEVVVGIAIEL